MQSVTVTSGWSGSPATLPVTITGYAYVHSGITLAAHVGAENLLTVADTIAHNTTTGAFTATGTLSGPELSNEDIVFTATVSDTTSAQYNVTVPSALVLTDIQPTPLQWNALNKLPITITGSSFLDDDDDGTAEYDNVVLALSLIHISEPTRPY